MNINFFNKIDKLFPQVNNICNEMGIKESIELVISPDIHTMPSAYGDATIELPYLFLIGSADLPKHLRLDSIDDPRLDDDQYLKDLFKWTQNYFVIDESNSPLTSQDKYILKIFAAFLRNELQAENAKEFVLRHEAAHILHQHNHGANNPAKLFAKSFYSKHTLLSMFSIASASCLSSFFWSTPPGWIATGIIAAYVSVVAIQTFAASHHSKICEKQADLTAVKDSEKARLGGIYLFDTIRQITQREREKMPYGKWLFNSSGDNRVTYFTHPLDSQRIAYLEKAKSIIPLHLVKTANT